MNNEGEWFTVNQVSKEVNIPGETIRRYARQYGEYLRMKKGEKRSYLIHESSFDTIKKIRYLLEQGKQREQIDEILQQTETLTIQTDDNEMNEYLMTLPQLHRETEKHIRWLSEQVEQQNDLIKGLANKLDQQQEYIDNRLKERDQMLMQSLDESLETQKQIAAEEKKESNKGFFSKLFKRDNKGGG
ncbi:MAG TPA: MerR family transcriptional regulator [Pseudogracilibacillus sp.]|nr:MerR family transcriptional regulator [Pseudogracilibacillus sp.]